MPNLKHAKKNLTFHTVLLLHFPAFHHFRKIIEFRLYFIKENKLHNRQNFGAFSPFFGIHRENTIDVERFCEVICGEGDVKKGVFYSPPASLCTLQQDFSLSDKLVSELAHLEQPDEVFLPLMVR